MSKTAIILVSLLLGVALLSNPLTGLPGAPSIEHEISKRINNKSKYAVCYLDLDNFKAYNDKYGYDQGDKVIIFTAKVLIQAITKEGNVDDFLGHIGGDDFIIVYPRESGKYMYSGH